MRRARVEVLMTAIDRSEYPPDLRRLATPLKAFPNLIKRPGAVRVMNALSDKLMVGRDVKGLACDTVSIPSANGTHRIRARVYRPLDHEGPLPAMLYIHGVGWRQARSSWVATALAAA